MAALIKVNTQKWRTSIQNNTLLEAFMWCYEMWPRLDSLGGVLCGVQWLGERLINIRVGAWMGWEKAAHLTCDRVVPRTCYRAFGFECNVHIRACDDCNTETFKAMKDLLHENVWQECQFAKTIYWILLNHHSFRCAGFRIPLGAEWKSTIAAWSRGP